MASSNIFFDDDYIWVDIPADPADLLIKLPKERSPSMISKRECDPYKDVWCEGNRYIKNADL